MHSTAGNGLYVCYKGDVYGGENQPEGFNFAPYIHVYTFFGIYILKAPVAVALDSTYAKFMKWKSALPS